MVAIFYCLSCNEYHDKATAKIVLKTGFRTELSNPEKQPLGVCLNADLDRKSKDK
ncbi:DUF3973 domain-containing protein [Ammoniphilus oxalaticus]|uniref:DUF3973 domain-containing protein n=1 Tax=Ammoniphilus oxalaticus TaxID=66863 RepID=UPI001474B750